MFSTRADIKERDIDLPSSCTDERCSEPTKAVRIVKATTKHFEDHPVQIYNPHPTQQRTIEDDLKAVVTAVVQQHCGKTTAKKIRECLNDEDILRFQARDSKSGLCCSVEIIPQLQPSAEEFLRLRLQPISYGRKKI